MKVIYVHGLDSTAKSMKGLLLERYCKHNNLDIEVIRPDLNQSPDQVFTKLCDLVQQAQTADNKVVLMGSSLGGYFSTLVSNEVGCAAFLLNPSTQPHISFQRFVNNSSLMLEQLQSETVLYQTIGGWEIRIKDLDWFGAHQLIKVKYPQKIAVLIKEGDELLDPKVATQFYCSQQVEVIVQAGGDHRMSDFKQQLPLIIDQIKMLIA